MSFPVATRCPLFYGYHSRTRERWWPSWSICTQVIFGLFLLCGNQQSDACQTVELERKGLSRIEPGTRVDQADAKRWNRIVLLSRPCIESGDVDAVATSIRDAASSLVLTILATVEAEADESQGMRYRLTDVGVGTSAAVDGVWKVVTLNSAGRLGLELGFVRRQLLAENERQFRQLQLVAKTTTLAIFDAPAILLRNAKHQDFVMRHFIWIDSRTGANAALLWLLERDAGGALSVVDEPMRWLQTGVTEKRTIHVDRTQFTLGIPGSRAFALCDLPPGKDIPWTIATRELAVLPSYSMDQIRDLSAALSEAIRANP